MIGQYKLNVSTPMLDLVPTQTTAQPHCEADECFHAIVVFPEVVVLVRRVAQWAFCISAQNLLQTFERVSEYHHLSLAVGEEQFQLYSSDKTNLSKFPCCMALAYRDWWLLQFDIGFLYCRRPTFKNSPFSNTLNNLTWVVRGVRQLHQEK
ncbi:MAG: hypothetical protein CM15mP83_4270 [Flavobacteriaceae bacterium]|nr:MAG: hypothetical protein CM15mP83_4270 [Flavobacteriaceae bacterium]